MKIVIDIEDAVLDCVIDRYADGEMPDDKSVFDMALYAIANGTVLKQGKWIDNTDCSCCGWAMYDDVTESKYYVGFKYCPNCGAEMVGDTDE